MSYTPPSLTTESLDKVKPKRVRWVWDKRIPQGKITVFGGDVGVGRDVRHGRASYQAY